VRMTRTKLLALALAVVLLPASSLSASTWHKSIAPAQAEAKKKNQIIFVDLFADWCGWCHRMEREVFPTEAFRNATKDMVLLRVDTEDRGEGTKLSRDYGITKLPTFLLLDPDGLLVGVIYGYAQAEQFAKRIGEVRSKFKLFQAEVAAEPSFRTDYKRRLSLAVDFMSRNGHKQAESRLRVLAAEKNVPKDVLDSVQYHLALNLYLQRKLDDSATSLKALLTRQPQGEPLERGHLLLGQIYYEQGNYAAALTELRNFKKTFPSSTLMPNVDSLLPIVENAVARAR
jgi:thioredoxin-related protein